MSSQICGSHEQVPFLPDDVVDDALQEAMESLELNPPTEFLDAISWDKPVQPGSGSMMKFAAPFPPL